MAERHRHAGRRGARLLAAEGALPLTFAFVTDGVESAVEQAKAAAGDKDVGIGGGASVAQQCLRAGLLDELQIHVAPLLLGGGVRLFDGDAEPVELETTRVIESPGVTHLRFRVVE
jgi:dihydrofolate reductase